MSNYVNRAAKFSLAQAEASNAKLFEDAAKITAPEAPDNSHAFTAVLFALFLFTLLLAILAGTNVYGALNNLRNDADTTRLSLNLVANTVRANDAVDSVAVGEGPEGKSLVLVERLESGNYETRIYLYEGYIVEEYSLAEAQYTPERATQIAPSSTFDFTYAHGLLTIITDKGNADIALRSIGGGE